MIATCYDIADVVSRKNNDLKLHMHYDVAFVFLPLKQEYSKYCSPVDSKNNMLYIKKRFAKHGETEHALLKDPRITCLEETLYVQTNVF